MAPKWENAPKFRAWLLDELDDREWRPVDLARKMQPDNPASMASSISKWLRGIRQPDPSSIDRMCEVLGCDTDYVLILAGHRAPVSSRLEQDERRSHVAAMIADMSAEDFQAIETIVRAFHDKQLREAS